MSDFLYISLASDKGQRRQLVMANIPSLFSEGLDDEPDIPVKTAQSFSERCRESFASSYGQLRQKLELAFMGEERRLRDENTF